MSSTKKVVIIFTGIFLASIIGMAITFGICGWDIFQRYRIEVSESNDLDLTGVSRISIEAASSDIRIVPSDIARVELNGTIIAADRKENYLEVSEKNGTLLIKVNNDNWFFGSWSIFNIFNASDLDLTVYLPDGAIPGVSVRCSSGNIGISGMEFGSIELRSSSGNISVKDCTAESFLSDVSSGDTRVESSALSSMRMTCRSGSISVRGTEGSIYAHSTSGNVDIADASGAVDVGCMSGSVSLDVAAGAVPPITANLHSGSIKIYMPFSAAFDLEARTTSGSIKSEIGISVSGSLNNHHAGENVSGTCNGGGPLVRISVTSGNIDIIGK